MNEAFKGKIGRLPKAIQEQVNRRLEQGEIARTLVGWLGVLQSEHRQPLQDASLYLGSPDN